MKWKKKKQTENKQEMKEKKIPTLKVGTHKKSVIALWAVLIVSVSFGVYIKILLPLICTQSTKKKRYNFD